MKQNQDKIEPQILEKYEILKKLGSGAYGHVWKAKNKKTGSTVALKKIFDAFQHSIDAQRTFREISIVKQLKHDKIIKLEEVLSAQNNQDIYLVFEFMETDLYHLLYESKLQQIHIKYIMYQVMLGIYYLHKNHLIHRDLKPSNILVNSDCSSKICDFGLVRFLGSEIASFNTLTEGVATRWYRAPEVLLGSNCYGVEADMWSLGCILGEVMLKTPLFPGNCTTNQLERILQLTGQPTPSDIKSIKAELGEVMISEISKGKIKKRTEIFSKVEDKNSIDLIYKLLEFNPTKRLTAEQALKHPYFADFFNAHDLDVKIENIVMHIDENVRLETQDYLNIIKEKLVNKDQGREESQDKGRKRISESPKSFSDLKKSRVSSSNSNSNTKSRIKSEENPQVLCPADTNLFKELIREKEKSLNKNQNRGASKENSFNNQNNQKKDKENESNDKKENVQKSFGNFQSFTVTNNLKKFGEEKKGGNFTTLKKTSKLAQR